MWRLFMSAPFVIGVFSAFWVGFSEGGFIILAGAFLERFFYSQKMGDSVETGGEPGPLGQLHFLSALVFVGMMLWALFPWRTLPDSLVPTSWMPKTGSPFTHNWLETFGIEEPQLDNPFEEKEDE